MMINNARGWIGAMSMVALLSLAGCGESGPGTPAGSAPPTVRTTVGTVERVETAQYRETVGTVEAAVTATLSAKLMGQVREIRVREGDRVKADDVLLRIDDRTAQAGLDQAAAALTAAENNEKAAAAGVEAAASGASLAGVTYERYRQLLAEDSVSRQEFDEAESRHRQARAALTQAEEMRKAAGDLVKQARAAVLAAKVGAADATVRAPFAGIITAKLVDPGDLASPGMPLLRIEQGAKQVHIDFPEDLAARLDPAQPLLVAIPALGLDRLDGRIQTITPVTDPGSRSVRLKIDIPEHESIRSGMFARVRVKLPGEAKLQVPRTAVVRQGQLEGIFLVDTDNVARFRLIRTGGTFDGQVEVVSGLAAGDRFIVAPPPVLKDGDKVEAG